MCIDVSLFLLDFSFLYPLRLAMDYSDFEISKTHGPVVPSFVLGCEYVGLSLLGGFSRFLSLWVNIGDPKPLDSVVA